MKILIVIDMQNDFVYGPLGTPEAKAIIPAIKEKINDNSYDKVFFTRDTHFDGYLDTQEGKLLPIKHCQIYSDGWRVIPELYLNDYLTVADNYYTINKFSFGYKWSDDLNSLECIVHEKITEIELCGVCTDICVVSNALILKSIFPEAKISVDSKACAGTTPEAHNAALTVMKSCQINVY